MPSQSGVVRSDSMNRTRGKHVSNYSTFDESLSYKLANTLRFGDLTPSFVMEGLPKDEISLNSKDMIDSLSLKAPFKGSIRKIKDTFAVPNMALLPFNWDKIYVQPVNGDDVPTDANCVLMNFPAIYSEFWFNHYKMVINNIPGSSATDADIAYWLTALMRILVLGEYVYSHGSLLNICGYKASSQFVHYLCSVAGGYDQFFDMVLMKVFQNFTDIDLVIQTSPSTFETRTFSCLSSKPHVYADDMVGSFRHMIEIFRENPLCYFDSTNLSIYYDTDKATTLADFATYASDDLFQSSSFVFVLPDSPSADISSPDFDDDLNVNNLNLSRILAYQICCFHYYTNSSIDPIYSAELYRQYLHSLNQYSSPNTINATFTCNGHFAPYDYLSGYILIHQSILTPTNTIVSIPYNRFGGVFDASDANLQSYLCRISSLAAIFAFRKSLRYGDYFVGSRPRPIAPINTDVAVNNNLVSVIDITKKQWAQKFGNAVMRSRQKVEEYVKDLFNGAAPAPDYHNPFFLTSQSELIYGDEVQNTADAQTSEANSRTSNFASGMNQYTFTFHNDDNHPCIYLQIISFDIKRFYTRSVERQFLHLDRYDMFNPDFQYIGDQPIYGIELGYPKSGYVTPVLTSPTIAKTFAYTSRDMEYKQRFDQASGGFCANLPGWILTDLDRSAVFKGVLDADFIRSYNTELDQFFLSLTGFSLASYFHFVCITNNFVNAKRAMAVDPQILG